MSTITILERVTLAVTDPRGWLGWRLANVGDRIMRLGAKLCDDVPTVGDDSDEWFAAGVRVGMREGRREVVAS